MCWTFGPFHSSQCVGHSRCKSPLRVTTLSARIMKLSVNLWNVARWSAFLARSLANFWLSLNHGVPAVQGRLAQRAMFNPSARALQLLHGVVEALRSGQLVRDGQADGRATLVVEALVAQARVLPAALLHEEPVGEALVRPTTANRRCDDRDLARGDGHEQTIIELFRTNCRSSVFMKSCRAPPRSISHLVPRDQRNVRGRCGGPVRRAGGLVPGRA